MMEPWEECYQEECAISSRKEKEARERLSIGAHTIDSIPSRDSTNGRSQLFVGEVRGEEKRGENIRSQHTPGEEATQTNIQRVGVQTHHPPTLGLHA